MRTDKLAQNSTRVEVAVIVEVAHKRPTVLEFVTAGAAVEWLMGQDWEVTVEDTVISKERLSEAVKPGSIVRVRTPQL